MKTQLTTLAIGVLLCGCSTTENKINSKSEPTPPELPKIGRAKIGDLKSWAQYYVDSGAANDMAEGMEMARKMFWADFEDPYSTLAKIEKNNEDTKKQIESDEK
ncbi:hypothetical protein [Pelagicoccus sp. SDUM812005]|uniref:hypothetical protein n=1 Tax=Pelagicoccus sp. SDUM812005 TaxID=3041257 RepID=UPI00280C6913|nr:hypothetical protein [Pelagicoccus sp. SDUM812005]MDQ8183863.1 hypothetical protein [Pelagicoccus sp. SDUM812005]